MQSSRLTFANSQSSRIWNVVYRRDMILLHFIVCMDGVDVDLDFVLYSVGGISSSLQLKIQCELCFMICEYQPQPSTLSYPILSYPILSYLLKRHCIGRIGKLAHCVFYEVAWLWLIVMHRDGWWMFANSQWLKLPSYLNRHAYKTTKHVAFSSGRKGFNLQNTITDKPVQIRYSLKI